MLKSIQKTVIGNSTSLANLNQKVDALLAPDPSISAEVTEEDIEDILRRTLPIKNMEDFSALQEDLKVNQPLRKKLCSILKLAGGKDIKDTCQNMLRKLMLDDLAQKFTYKGKLAGKARFAGTEISDALNASIRAIIPGNISTDDKIKECVSEWLTQAKFREQKRERRKRNQEVQPFMELNMSQYPTLCRAQIDQDALVLQSMLDQINEPVDLDEN